MHNFRQYVRITPLSLRARSAKLRACPELVEWGRLREAISTTHKTEIAAAMCRGLSMTITEVPGFLGAIPLIMKGFKSIVPKTDKYCDTFGLRMV
ncbi:MAG: hypothetical protein A2Z25_07925 [Planctomycetes bacterium RBG_16_55_9]|nr:MAG: hypothetical protein A2Z25_07925 [Planctomycetes bacterium RBG_16_55_9]